MSDKTVDLVRYADISLPLQPLLVPWIEAVELSNGWLQLRSAESWYTLRHSLFAIAFRAVEPLLNGKFTTDEIAAHAVPDVLPTTVVFLLKGLRGLGLLVEGHRTTAQPAVPDAEFGYLTQFSGEPASAAAMLSAARVLIVGAETFRQDVTSLLCASGCQIEGQETASQAGDAMTGGFDLVVGAFDGFASDDAIALNDVAVAHGTLALHVGVLGRLALLGPLVIPAETACMRCLQMRLSANREGFPADPAARSHVRPTAWNLLSYAPLRMVLVGQVVSEVHRILGRYAAPVTLGRCIEFDAAAPFRGRQHTVLRVPGCAACDQVQRPMSR